MVPVGLGARDTLRLEAGMPLYGNELGPDTTPFEAGLGRVVKPSPRRATSSAGPRSKPAADGPRKKLVGLVVRGRGIARHGYEVFAGDRRTGVVTSGTLSPTLGEPIAMAYVAPSDAEPGTILAVGIRDQRSRPRSCLCPSTEGRLATEPATRLAGRAQGGARRWCPRICATPKSTSGSGSRARWPRRDHGLRRRAARRRRLRGAAGDRPDVAQFAADRRDRVGQGRERSVRPVERRGRRGQRELHRCSRSCSTAIPFGKGWMLRIKVADAGQVDGLLDAAAYEALIAEA
jgi:hypothetical protein